MKAPEQPKPALLALIGHTAAGKTELAAHLALQLNGEVISADSRQVYREMDIGTGKDLADYTIGEATVPAHLIDIVNAGDKYSLFDFYTDFHRVFSDLHQRQILPVLCGGTGLYVESVLRGYHLGEVPVNESLREAVRNLSDDELIARLKSLKTLHNKTDIDTRERLVRALEIALSDAEDPKPVHPPIAARVYGIRYETENRRRRITERLTQRLKSGMIEEVQHLLKTVPAENLIYYGLEYKYLTQYCLGQLSYNEMFTQLNIAIHQFAKRQMTWFRGMERRGINITWVQGELPQEEKLDIILADWRTSSCQ